MLKESILILFSIIWSVNSGIIPQGIKPGPFISIGAVWQMVQLGLEFTKVLDRMKAGEALDGSDDQKNIIHKLDNINEQLRTFQSHAREKLNDIEELIHSLPDEIEIRSTRLSVLIFIEKTNDKWDIFVNYMKNGIEGEQFNQLADEIIHLIDEHLVAFRTTLTPPPGTASGYFRLVAKQGLEQIDTLCGNGETFHDVITRFLHMVLQTEMKAYILSIFAYKVRHQKSGEQLWKIRADHLKKKFREQFQEYVNIYRESLNSTKLPYIRACDPKVWKRDENFYELDQLQQQTIYQRQYSDGHTCAELAKNTTKYPLKKLNDHAACNTTLYNCDRLEWLPIPDVWEICLWRSGPYRIRYIKDKGSIYGTDKDNSCPHEDLYSRYTLAHYLDGSLDECSCQCRTNKWRIAVVPQFSGLEHIIVGLRFRTNGTIIYIQIAQAHVGPNGSLSNFSWLPMLDILQHEIFSRTITIETAIFALEDLILPPGQVLNGIGFAEVRDRYWYTVYGFEIWGANVDFQRGIVGGMKKIETQDRKRKSYPVPGKNSINMASYERSRVIRGEYDKISLRQSDLSHDFGQSILPLLDAVSVMTNPLLPIGGVGLFVKAQKEHAGFLSLRLFPMNYTDYMEASLQKYNLLSLAGDD